MKARTPLALVTIMLLCGAVFAQVTPVPPDKPAPAGKAAPDAKAPADPAGGNKVTGLTLPPDFEVEADEQFVDIQAQCKGQVTFLVLSTAKRIKFKPVKKGETTITVGIPPEDCQVSVFCVGYLEDTKEFTPWARCNITVKGPKVVVPPQPDPDPNTKPMPPPAPLLPAGTKLHITIIEDPAVRTEATRALLEDANARQALVTAGHKMRTQDPTSAASKRLGLTALYAKIGGPTLVVQVNDGKPGVHPPVGGTPVALPATSAALRDYINKLVGGN